MKLESSPTLWLRINGLSAINFWLALWLQERSQGIIFQTVLKFGLYAVMILWINSCYYLAQCARDIDVETWEFQKEQVKLTLWILGILILMELPLWITAISIM